MLKANHYWHMGHIEDREDGAILLICNDNCDEWYLVPKGLANSQPPYTAYYMALINHGAEGVDDFEPEIVELQRGSEEPVDEIFRRWQEMLSKQG